MAGICQVVDVLKVVLRICFVSRIQRLPVRYVGTLRIVGFLQFQEFRLDFVAFRIRDVVVVAVDLLDVFLNGIEQLIAPFVPVFDLSSIRLAGGSGDVDLVAQGDIIRLGNIDILHGRTIRQDRLGGFAGIGERIIIHSRDDRLVAEVSFL